jgi:hypothetical protein
LITVNIPGDTYPMKETMKGGLLKPKAVAAAEAESTRRGTFT